MDTDRKKKLLWMDLIKVFAAFLVVMQHSISSSFTTLPVNSREWMVVNCIFMISRMGVPIFIMCSGAGILAREHSVKEIWQRNILMLLKVYVAWMAVFGIKEVCGIWINGENASLRVMINAFIKSILFGGYHTWFIFTLLGLYAITPFLYLIVQKKENLCYFLVLSIIFTVILPIFSGIEWLSRLFAVADNINMHFVVGYSLYFVIGYFISTYMDRRWEKYAAVIFILSAVTAYVWSVLVSLDTGTANQEAYGLFSPCGFVMNTCLAILFQKYFGNKRESIILNKIATLQQYGIAVYLVHVIFVESWAKTSGIFTLILGVLIWILSLVISMIVYRIPILNQVLFIHRNEERQAVVCTKDI